MLAGLVASPTQVRAAPQHRRSRASASSYVLGHMREDGYISDAEYAARARRADRARRRERRSTTSRRPYFVEHVRQIAHEALRQPRSVQGRPASSTRRSTPACRPPPRARCAGVSSRSIAGSASAVRSAGCRRRSAAPGPAARRIRSPARATDTQRTRRSAPARAAATARWSSSCRATAASSSTSGPSTAAARRRGRRRTVARLDQRGRPSRPSMRRRPPAGAARPPRNDGVELAQRPVLQGALVVIEPSTGRVARDGRRLRLDRPASSTARPRPSARSARRSSRSSTPRRSRPGARRSIACTTARTR